VAGRALTVVTDWAFGSFGLHRIVVEHSTRNPASCRVAEGAGYPLEGTQRSAALHADGWHDMHLHARIAPTTPSA
jgi:ribosomal-protein-alanine N-acetyltransferase